MNLVTCKNYQNDIDIKIISQETLKMNKMEAWRMNILAVSLLRKKVFIACKNKIDIIGLFENGQINKKLQFPSLKITNQSKIPVNQIKIKRFADKEYLFTVDHDSKLQIFDLDNLNQPLLILDNKYHDAEDNTTWSLDIYFTPDYKYIACGSNARRVSMWNASSGSLSERKTLDCHQNNVPHIEFSPCGKFLASTSIDKTLKITLVKTGNVICQYDLKDWGWSILWIKKKEIQFSSLFYKNCKVIQNDQNFLGLDEYLIFHTEANRFNLFDPLPIEKERKNLNFELANTKCVKMQLLASEEEILNPFYSSYIRFNFSKYLQKFSLVASTGQHSNMLCLISIYYDNSMQKQIVLLYKKFSNNIRFDIQIIKRFQLSGSLLGIDIFEPPNEQNIRCLNRTLIFLINLEKQLTTIEISNSNYQSQDENEHKQEQQTFNQKETLQIFKLNF